MLANKLKIILFAGLPLLSGCVQEAGNASTPEHTALANPASTKCINDGYQLVESPLANGVGSELRCYNPVNKLLCEQWDYFRGDCKLE